MGLQIRKALTEPSKAFRVAAYQVKKLLFWDSCYRAMREPKMEGPLVDTAQKKSKIVADLTEAQFGVKPLVIDIAEYEDYLAKADYSRFPTYLAGGRDPRFHEKSLEHYVAATLLQLSAEDIYIDVASYESPVPEIYHRLYGCTIYRQDLLYPTGIHGNTIGGDAANMPVPNGFATKMGLHCSFEHFEGDSDIRFINEVSRVLRGGGRTCIVPLYLSATYAVHTDPIITARANIPFENDAVLCCIKNFRNRHGRHYDVSHLSARIRQNLHGLDMTIFCIENAKDVHDSCYVSFAAILQKPAKA